MAADAPGHVDFVDDGFVARAGDDPAVVARMQEIQRCRWVADRSAWIVAPHWPSVRRLLHIASELGFRISGEARAAEARVREEGEFLEYSLDVVHGNYGEAWFVCKVGDDDELRHQVSDLPGAFWDDAWNIPTDWEQCCVPLLDIVRSDMRIEVSEAAWRLLEQPDIGHEFIRSNAPRPAERSDTPPASPEEPRTATRKPRVSTHGVRLSAPAARTTRETG